MYSSSFWLNRAAYIALRGTGSVSPNPLVGAVLVHNNRIIGEGWHACFGQAHAEVNCIHSVSEADRCFLPESVLYVTLEPCNHWGKTPPCTNAIQSSNITQVVVGSVDPNPLVSGQGIARLRSAGIQVDYIEHHASHWINRRFLRIHHTKRPYIILKWAESANGFMGIYGKRVSVSSETARSIVHQWRAAEDAILVGSKTASVDNPLLTVRSAQGKNPLRIVLDNFLSVPSSAHVYTDGLPTVMVNSKREDVVGAVQFLKVNPQNSIEETLSFLHQRQIGSILVEGGHLIHQTFINKSLVDEIRVIRSKNSVITDPQAIPSPQHSFVLSETMDIGEDCIMTFFPEGNASYVTLPPAL